MNNKLIEINKYIKRYLDRKPIAPNIPTKKQSKSLISLLL